MLASDMHSAWILLLRELKQSRRANSWAKKRTAQGNIDRNLKSNQQGRNWENKPFKESKNNTSLVGSRGNRSVEVMKKEKEFNDSSHG